MKRDDETLLEYLIRLAKEGGEGLQGLGAERLKKARPDVAARRGLLEPQYDETMVMEEEVFQPPVQPEIPTPDRASLESMIAQAGETGPVTSRMPDIGQMDTVGERDQGQPTSDFMMEGLIRDTLPRQPGQLPNQLLEERVTTTQPPTANLASAIMPEARQFRPDDGMGVNQDISVSPVAPNPTSGQALSEQRAYMKEAGASREEAYEWWMGKEGGEVKEYEPGRIAKGFGKDVARYKKFWDDNKSWLNTPIGIMIENALNPEKEIDVDAVSKTHSQMSKALGKKDTTKKVPTTDQAEKNIDKVSKKTGQGSPSFDGHNSKAEFFKSMGLSLEGNKFADRMDKIDSEAGMFDMIAMLGGAGNSRAGKNFRDKSYQRLRTEMQMDERDWDRAYQMFSHPWDTWFDEKGLRDPISRLRGTGPPPGGGWAKTRPDKAAQLTTPTRLIEEIKSLYTGEESLDEIMLRFAQADPNFSLNPEGAMEGAAISAQTYLGLNFVPWTRVEKQQVRRLMAEGKVNDVVKWIEEKSLDPNDWHVPYDMIDEVNAWWEENESKWTGPKRKISRGRTPKAN